MAQDNRKRKKYGFSPYGFQPQTTPLQDKLARRFRYTAEPVFDKFERQIPQAEEISAFIYKER